MRTSLPPAFSRSVVVLAVAVLFLAATPPSADGGLREQLEQLMQEARMPGLAVAVLVDGTLVYIEALGWANIEAQQPMRTSTVLNIGSVSKLVTSSAVLQLWEEGAIELDVDVSRYLPFAVRHPAAADAITVRQLLTHTSGIQDGPSYGASYACGDPEVSLEEWLRGYFVRGGAYYSTDNFLDMGPGRTFEYTNVGYGLLGLIAQQVAGRDFATLTRERIFGPLGMDSTGWSLTSIDLERHATPYWIEGISPELDPEERQLLAEETDTSRAAVPFCLYSFYNYPDGLLRTTIEDLASFARAALPGAGAREPLLSQATRDLVFSSQTPGVETDGRVQGLGWRRHEVQDLGLLWGHGGADPGIRAHVLHRPSDGVTVLAMTNSLVVEEFRPILALLFAHGASWRSSHLEE